MRRFLLWLSLLGVIAVAGAAVFLFWDLDWRWRPKTIGKDQAEISQALEQSGWVSPHLTGPKLYIIAYRDCPACLSFAQSEFPRLQAADVDTRVIMIARADENGQVNSTAAERSTVAELWTNRSWKLFQQWSLATPQTWAPPGVPPADGDAARTAVVGASRQLVATLTPQLNDNGVRFAYPLLIWWTKDGQMRACACENAQTYRYVEKDLGA
jgi:hypothetical protein